MGQITFGTSAGIFALSSLGMTTAPFPYASCPQQCHSGCAFLEKSSILFWVGCILEIRSMNLVGLAE